MPAGCPTTPHGDKKPVRPDKTAPRPPRHSQDRLRPVACGEVGAAKRVAGTGKRRACSERESRSAGRPERAAEMKYGGGAAAQPNADGGTACLAFIARTGAPRGAAPPHSVTIQALPIHVQVVTCEDRVFVSAEHGRKHHRIRPGLRPRPSESVGTRVTGVPGQPKLDTGARGGPSGLPASQRAAAPPGPCHRAEGRRAQAGQGGASRAPGGERKKRGRDTCPSSATATCFRWARTAPATDG